MENYIPDELIDRIERDALNLAAGENDLELRLAVQNSAFHILANKLREARHPLVMPPSRPSWEHPTNMPG